MAIITISDVHAHLNDTDTGHDPELQGFIDAATPIIENIVGPVESTAYTEMYDGGGPTICLRHYPVLSVTSISENWGVTAYTLSAQNLAATTNYDYVLDATTGILRRMSGGYGYRFAAGSWNVTVSYTAGRASVPAPVRMAALELVRTMYDQSQLGGSAPLRDEFSGVTPMMGFLVPNRVKELLEPYRMAPGIA